MKPIAPIGIAPTGSSFFLSLRILPASQREAMYAIYGFCRAVDDIADSDAPRGERLEALARWRAAIHSLYNSGTAPPSLQRLSAAIAAFRLRKADFEAVIDGMEMDVSVDIAAPPRDLLTCYIDRVAVAPGRLSVQVFGLADERGAALSHHLGNALQITNILRDLDEDAELGRLYLPRELLNDAGLIDRLRTDEGPCTGSLQDDVEKRKSAIRNVIGDPRIAHVCESLTSEARAHFERARIIMDAAPRRAVRAPRLMAAAYASLADNLAARGWLSPRGRVAKRKRAILAALVRYGFF